MREPGQKGETSACFSEKLKNVGQKLQYNNRILLVEHEILYLK